MSGTDLRAAPRYYWDTCVFIAWLNEEAGRIEKIRPLIELLEAKKITIVTSTITILETLEFGTDPEKMQEFRQFLRREEVTLRAVDAPVVNIARDMRDFYKTSEGAKTLSLPDSIHLATAEVYKVKAFHTYDRNDTKKSLGLIPLSGNVAGYKIEIEEPEPEVPEPQEEEPNLFSSLNEDETSELEQPS